MNQSDLILRPFSREGFAYRRGEKRTTWYEDIQEYGAGRIAEEIQSGRGANKTLCTFCRLFVASILSDEPNFERNEDNGVEVKDGWVHEVQDRDNFNRQPDEFVTFQHRKISYFRITKNCRVSSVGFWQILYGRTDGRVKILICLIKFRNDVHGGTPYQSAIAELRVYCSPSMHGDGRLAFYMEHDQGGLFKRESIKMPTFREDAFGFIQAALNDCRQNHPLCRRPIPTLPKRVVTICDEGSHDLFLYVPEAEKAEYVALSYCWGNTNSMLTTKNTFEFRKSGMSAQSMPATLRHAIHVCRRLGIKYLWIDSLCILQGNANDFAREAPRMADYYRNALFVISAFESPNANAGYLFQRSPCVLSAKNARIFVQSLGMPGEMMSEILSMGEVNRRAWCFQEHGLSTARVFLGAKAILWECRTYRVLENGHKESTHPVFESFGQVMWRIRMPEIPTDTSNFGRFGWEKILEEYTSRRLTKPEDRPAAFGRIAQLFLENGWRTGRYLAGLWENDLYRDILWKPGLILNRDPAVKEVYPESTAVSSQRGAGPRS
jgi:hypothetical protein